MLILRILYAVDTLRELFTECSISLPPNQARFHRLIDVVSWTDNFLGILRSY